MRTLIFLFLIAASANGAAAEKQRYTPGPISWVFVLGTSKDEVVAKVLSQEEIAAIVDKGYVSKSGNIKCDLEFKSSWVDSAVKGKSKIYVEQMILRCFARGLKISPSIVLCSTRETPQEDRTSLVISDEKTEHLSWHFSCITPTNN